MARQDRDSQYVVVDHIILQQIILEELKAMVEIIIEKIIEILQPLRLQQKKLQQFLKQIK
jgi:hypothetical protein